MAAKLYLSALSVCFTTRVPTPTPTANTTTTSAGPLQKKQAVMAGVHIPEPVFALSLFPAASGKQDDFEEALAILSRDDPSLIVEVEWSELGKYIGRCFHMLRTVAKTHDSGM